MDGLLNLAQPCMVPQNPDTNIPHTGFCWIRFLDSEILRGGQPRLGNVAICTPFPPTDKTCPSLYTPKSQVPGAEHLAGDQGHEWKTPAPASFLCTDPHKETQEENIKGPSIQ